MLELKIPPPIYMLILTTIMWKLAENFPAFNLISTHIAPLGLGLIGFAILLDVWSLLLFLKAKTTPNPWKPDNSQSLVISGLYHFSRNPMYVGLMIILVGWAIYQTNLLSFLLLPVFYGIITSQQIIPEERILKEKFGDDYVQYQQKVRRWL